MEQTMKQNNPTQANPLNVKKLTLLAMLTAIIILMAFTPLGCLRVGAVYITFIMIPVVIGAVTTGVKGGAFLGAVFGATSFVQCFGMDAFGTALMEINPFYTVLTCFVPRILMGALTALIFQGLQKFDKTNAISFMVACLSGAVLNTIGFVGLLILFFRNSDYLQSISGSVTGLITTLVTVNALIEAIACLVIGAAFSKVIDRFVIHSK